MLATTICVAEYKMKYFPGFSAASSCIRFLALARPSVLSIQRASAPGSPEKMSHLGKDAITAVPTRTSTRHEFYADFVI